MPIAPGATSRLVLRDGSTAGVRPSTGADRDAVRRFFDELSPESRRLRFLATSNASEGLLTQLCDNHDPRKALTLLVCRRGEHGTHVIGVGSYFADSEAGAGERRTGLPPQPAASTAVPTRAARHLLVIHRLHFEEDCSLLHRASG